MANEKGMAHLVDEGVAVGKMEILLEVGGFHIDRGMEMTIIKAHIDVQKCDLGGVGVPSEFDEVITTEAFKELDEGVGNHETRGLRCH